MKDLGYEAGVRVWTDSSAAMGIAGRSGFGRLRHLETHALWVQERLRSKAFELRKLRGEVNPPDLFIKYLSNSERIVKLVELFGCSYRGGRAEAAPKLRPKERVHLEEEDEHAFDTADVDLLEYQVKEAEIHDSRRLPHEFGDEDIHKMFPNIQPASPI